ncbi:hypothetical protein [Caloramator sp. ALD01]|uniref:hypothetical protein n=1 Tax=Caloramator sp. ALD01 TaxID=1031288 RepID=UPI00040726AC|nr:hypothetical protein [Caloramator sp. ALD01]
MKSRLIFFYNEFKSIGKISFIPVVVAVFIGIINNIYIKDLGGKYLLIQLFFSTSISFLVSMSFYNFIEEEGKEVFYSFPLNRLRCGILKLLLFWLYFVLILIFCLVLSKINDNSFYIALSYISLQGLFFLSVTYYLCMMTKNITVSIAFIYLYISICFLGRDTIINYVSVLSIYKFVSCLSFEPIKMIVICIVSIVFVIVAQRKFNTLVVVD